MGGKKSQRKGAAGERELAAILQEYGYDCTRGGDIAILLPEAGLSCLPRIPHRSALAWRRLRR